jgi:HPt (histidine-containing phosphotransfer) domain-containing protein
VFSNKNGSIGGSTSALDLEMALSRAGGDPELLHEIAVLFIDDYPKALQDLRNAIQTGDIRLLERSAHGLKGSVANFGAQQAVSAAQALEMMARNREIEGAEEVIRSLELALAALSVELQQL